MKQLFKKKNKINRVVVVKHIRFSAWFSKYFKYILTLLENYERSLYDWKILSKNVVLQFALTKNNKLFRNVGNKLYFIDPDILNRFPNIISKKYEIFRDIHINITWDTQMDSSFTVFPV